MRCQGDRRWQWRRVQCPVRAHVRRLRPQGRTECEDSGVASRLPRRGIFRHRHGPRGPRNPGSPYTEPHLPGPAELPSSLMPANLERSRSFAIAQRPPAPTPDPGAWVDQSTGTHDPLFHRCIFSRLSSICRKKKIQLVDIVTRPTNPFFQKKASCFNLFTFLRCLFSLFETNS